jgi:hypothetical protein
MFLFIISTLKIVGHQNPDNILESLCTLMGFQFVYMLYGVKGTFQILRVVV